MSDSLIYGGGQFMGRILFLLDRDERGQGLAEYALILGLIAVIAIAALLFIGTSISGMLSYIAFKL